MRGRRFNDFRSQRLTAERFWKIEKSEQKDPTCRIVILNDLPLSNLSISQYCKGAISHRSRSESQLLHLHSQRTQIIYTFRNAFALFPSIPPNYKSTTSSNGWYTINPMSTYQYCYCVRIRLNGNVQPILEILLVRATITTRTEIGATCSRLLGW